ncbi:MAG: hypothetical protein HQK77_12170 [Desulfobacterales bacterium]|nr:hypothetical protein [Desulfobacterales bacterium]
MQTNKTQQLKSIHRIFAFGTMLLMLISFQASNVLADPEDAAIVWNQLIPTPENNGQGYAKVGWVLNTLDGNVYGLLNLFIQANGLTYQVNGKRYDQINNLFYSTFGNFMFSTNQSQVIITLTESGEDSGFIYTGTYHISLFPGDLGGTFDFMGKKKRKSTGTVIDFTKNGTVQLIGSPCFACPL